MINVNLYLEDGNNRAIWYCLNGIDTIDAEEDVLDSDDTKNQITASSRRRIQEENARQGIFSPYDLAARVKNPEKYSSD
ncbi:hypothetical protein GF386_03615, partial [Candidatus Pacearchaeota archaeon]|nr:hypothetical protein [Candidatus Pacearchaeota archaeon]MBD3283239.1 hypothetical protein [Candidatus Pacearchaeota archaeon]